jgi:hypothetical protein
MSLKCHLESLYFYGTHFLMPILFFSFACRSSKDKRLVYKDLSSITEPHVGLMLFYCFWDWVWLNGTSDYNHKVTVYEIEIIGIGKNNESNIAWIVTKISKYVFTIPLISLSKKTALHILRSKNFFSWHNPIVNL